MERLAARWADVAHFVVLYTQEAHPGQGAFVQYDEHQSLAERSLYANELHEEFAMVRTILLDTMESAVQKAYGELPNSQFMIVNGRIVHSSPWADPEDVESWLQSWVRRRQQRAL